MVEKFVWRCVRLTHSSLCCVKKKSVDGIRSEREHYIERVHRPSTVKRINRETEHSFTARKQKRAAERFVRNWIGNVGRSRRSRSDVRVATCPSVPSLDPRQKREPIRRYGSGARATYRWTGRGTLCALENTGRAFQPSFHRKGTGGQ